MTDRERVGFAGLGTMGSRMAANVLKNGYPLTVWNRTRTRAEALLARGRLGADGRPTWPGERHRHHHDQRSAGGVRGLPRSGRPAGRRAAGRDPGRHVDHRARGGRRLSDEAAERGAEIFEAPVTGSRNGAPRGRWSS